MDNFQFPTQLLPETRHVLLATDLGASSVQATDTAIDLAAGHRAILLILSVVPPAGLHRLGRRRGPDAERERRERNTREIVARAAARGVIATSVIWYGDPAESILEATRTQRADVVVLGSRKHADIGRLVLGSVSAQVTREATCPVLVVPA